MFSLTLLTLAAGAATPEKTLCYVKAEETNKICEPLNKYCVPKPGTHHGDLGTCEDEVPMDPKDATETPPPCASHCENKGQDEEVVIDEGRAYCICHLNGEHVRTQIDFDHYVRACIEWDNHDDRNCTKYGNVQRTRQSEEYDYADCHNSNLDHCSIDGICFHVVTDFQGDHVGDACTFSRGNIIGNTEKCLCKVNKVDDEKKDLRRNLRAEKLEPAAELLQ